MRIDRIWTDLDKTKKKHVYFHLHNKCQDITDNRGDIELDLSESKQNTVLTNN